MSALATLLAQQLDDARDWTRKLLADVREADWGFQPQPGLAHPLWICGHLAVSQNVLVHVRCLGVSVLPDAFAAKFTMGGPIKSLREWDYPSAEETRRVFDELHDRTLTAIGGMSDALLGEPAYGKDGAPHPHYRDKCGAVTHTARHEAFHAGQLALIRRLLGKTFLR